MLSFVDLQMKKYLLFILTINLVSGQQIAKTNDDRAVVLYDNGTWHYLGEERTSKKIQKSDTQIYITKSGKKYHLDGCRWLKSKIPATITEANSKGLTPCKVCSPPSKSNITKNIKTQFFESDNITQGSRCQGNTQKGNQCKRISQKEQDYCWQHL